MLTLTFFLKCLKSEQGSVLLFLITFLHIWSMCGLMEESLFFASHQYLLVCSDVILLFCYKTLFRRFCASISEIKHSVTFRQVFLQMCLCLFFFFKKKKPDFCNDDSFFVVFFFFKDLLYSLSSSLLISPSVFSLCEDYFSYLTLMNSSWCFIIAFLLLVFASISTGLQNSCVNSVIAS